MKDLTQAVRPTAAPWVGKVAVLAALATVGLVIHAFYLDVVVHPFFFSPFGIVAMLVPGMAFSAWRLIGGAMKYPPAPLGPRDILGWLLMPVFTGLILWLVLAKTPAWLAAGLFGTPHSEVHAFYISAKGGNKGCTYRARVTDDLRLVPKYLCVSSTFASQHFRQRVELRLVGKRTWLGFRITHFETVDAP